MYCASGLGSEAKQRSRDYRRITLRGPPAAPFVLSLSLLCRLAPNHFEAIAGPRQLPNDCQRRSTCLLAYLKFLSQCHSRDRLYLPCETDFRRSQELALSCPTL